MNRIMDYDALFNERGEQANICTDAGLGGSYASGREEPRQTPVTFVRRTPADQRPSMNTKVTIRRRPVRFVEFDTFEKPERTEEEVKECFEKTALLFASIITMIVAIAILL